MKTGIVKFDSITVIGKEGVCTPEQNIVSQLWAEANGHFPEAAALGKKDNAGNFAGFWGLMSDLGRHYLPWENEYTTGLYLAGVETETDSEAPAGWVKWVVPERTCFVLEIGEGGYQTAFRQGLETLPKLGFRLSGAVCDYTEPSTGKNFLVYPVEAI